MHIKSQQVLGCYAAKAWHKPFFWIYLALPIARDYNKLSLIL
jgi:hypothetical protein